MIEGWLLKFLRRQFRPERPHADGACVRLQLFHVGGRAIAIRNWPFEDSPADDDAITKQGEEIQIAAQEHANELGGRQRYQLSAFYARSPTVVAESHVFLREGGGQSDEADEEQTITDSEGPTLRGLMAQLMRHNEANARALVIQATRLTESQGRMLAMQSQRIQQLEADRFAHMQAYERTLSEQQARDLATKEHELRVKAWSEGIEKLHLLVPLVVNKLAGQRILPEPVTALNEMVGSLVETLKPDQIEKMATVLTPEQMIVIVNLIEERRALLARTHIETDGRAQALVRTDGNGAGETEKIR